MSRVFSISIKGETFEVTVDEITSGAPRRTAPTVIPTTKDRMPTRSPVGDIPAMVPKEEHQGSGSVSAAMPGTVVAVMVEEGQKVVKGQTLLVLEAMKMENQITAPKDGKITSLKVKNGEKVAGGAVLCTVE